MKQPNFIAPSILSADFAKLGEEVDNVLVAGADIVHFDVMDNHYVPNLTIGPLVCEALRNHGVTAPIDVHLMVKPVDRIIPDFAKAGASYITFHPEASEHIDRTIGLIKENGCKVGLVFNPATSLHYLEHVIDQLDMVLLMSVNPGFGVKGAATYSIWLYKGGARCQHKWFRKTYMLTLDGDKSLVTTGKAKSFGFKFPVNDKLVPVAPKNMKYEGYTKAYWDKMGFGKKKKN